MVDPSDVLQDELRPSTTLLDKMHRKGKSALGKNERTPTKLASDAKSEFATRNHLKKIQKFDTQKPGDDLIQPKREEIEEENRSPMPGGKQLGLRLQRSGSRVSRGSSGASRQ